jgi:hypothetical protein
MSWEFKEFKVWNYWCWMRRHKKLKSYPPPDFTTSNLLFFDTHNHSVSVKWQYRNRTGKVQSVLEYTVFSHTFIAHLHSECWWLRNSFDVNVNIFKYNCGCWTSEVVLVSCLFHECLCYVIICRKLKMCKVGITCSSTLYQILSTSDWQFSSWNKWMDGDIWFPVYIFFFCMSCAECIINWN